MSVQEVPAGTKYSPAAGPREPPSASYNAGQLGTVLGPLGCIMKGRKSPHALISAHHCPICSRHGVESLGGSTCRITPQLERDHISVASVASVCPEIPHRRTLEGKSGAEPNRDAPGPCCPLRPRRCRRSNERRASTVHVSALHPQYKPGAAVSNRELRAE